MLAAEKAQLQGNLAQDIIRIRERELQFYAESLNSIATVGALLAGISFSMFFDMWNWDMFGENYTPPLAHIMDISRALQSWNAAVWIQQFLFLLQCWCTLATITTNLMLVQNCIVTNIAGTGLALRGPDGSVNRSLTHMRRELRRAARLLHRGLSYLAMTIAVQVSGSTVTLASARSGLDERARRMRAACPLWCPSLSQPLLSRPPHPSQPAVTLSPPDRCPRAVPS